MWSKYLTTKYIGVYMVEDKKNENEVAVIEVTEESNENDETSEAAEQ